MLIFKFFFQSGVRALMLDTYDYEGDVWLCHSFDEKCFEFTKFVSPKISLTEIKPSKTKTFFPSKQIVRKYCVLLLRGLVGVEFMFELIDFKFLEEKISQHCKFSE